MSENSNSINNLFDDFGVMEKETQAIENEPKHEVQTIHHDHWTLVDAFNVINLELPKCQLGDDFMIICQEAFEYLEERLGFSPVQCTVLAMLIESGKAMSYRMMGMTLGISRLTMMTYSEDIEEMAKKRWLTHRGAKEINGTFEGFALQHGVVTAVRHNLVFEPENLNCEDINDFVYKVANKFDSFDMSPNPIDMDEMIWMDEIVKTNLHIPFCKMLNEELKTNDMYVLMLLVSDMCNFYGEECEGITPDELEKVYQKDGHREINSFIRGTHQLIGMGLVEHKCVDGIADTNKYVATSHLKDDILAGFEPTIKKETRDTPKMAGHKSYKDITPKELFYNDTEKMQVERLKSLLSPEQLPQVQARLKEKGMRTGVCILMHGEPGTGKTATAFELARQTERDIIQVNVTDFKDKYVGESENKLKGIFNKYRTWCRNSEKTPILLLNEGDAILSKRTTNIERSVDQMSNALQNILLEEMENLEGIMIVTTNLTVNLDSAFERRFIFKIRYEKPDTKVKACIWKSMIDNIDDEDSMELAGLYDMSGGEIENIARKVTMEYVLTGATPDIEMIKSFAKEEKIMTKKRAVVGFNAINS